MTPRDTYPRPTVPTELIDRAVDEYGQKYVFVYPKREWTEADYFANAAHPTGKRLKGFYGVCTNCRTTYDDPDTPGTKGTCRACGHDVIFRRGWTGKKNLKHWFYCAMWDVKSPREVWLYEAIIKEHDWNNWEETGAPETDVYFLRRTVLTPGKSQSYDRNNCPVRKARAASDAEIAGLSITGGSRFLVECSKDIGVIGEEELAGTFLHGILGALLTNDKLSQIVRVNYLIRLNEEPITELLYKAGYFALAWVRVFKQSAAHGTRRINYAAKSPKQMFRGLKKDGIDRRLLEILNGIDPEAREGFAEWELEWTIDLLKTYKPRAAAVRDFLSVKSSLKYTIVDELAPHWSLERISAYISGHDPLFWRDYLKTAKKIGEDLAERRVAFPEDLREAHDAVMLRDQQITEDETIRAVRQRCKELTARGYEYRRRNICTVIPAQADDIIAEGISLSHCVGRYVEDHAAGETNIIFIRRTDAPKKSWFTLEVDPDTLKFLQCYGDHNKCSGLPDNDYADRYDPEVGEFLKNYARRLKWGEAEYKKTRRKNKKCRKTA